MAIGYFLFIALLIYLMTLIGTGMSYGNIAMIIQLSTLAIFPLVNMLPLINVIKSSSAIYDKIAKPEEWRKAIPNPRSSSSKNESKFKIFIFNMMRGPCFMIWISPLKKERNIVKRASGSGKSTLIKLLSGIYDQYDGKITVDGTDLRAISLKSLNNRSSYIFQDVFLFEASLKDNIALFKEIDPYRLAEAIEKSGLKEFVDSHPKGVDFQIEETARIYPVANANGYPLPERSINKPKSCSWTKRLRLSTMN